MGKFRSKLKRSAKGIKWTKGHSSTTNPENMKHRLKAKSRFFQPNLSLGPPENDLIEKPGLTQEAILKHDASLFYANKSEEPTVNDIARSLKSASINDVDIFSESASGTNPTFKTFASDYSACTHVSFKKLLSCFRASSEVHREMLAILTALTEIIKDKGGTESSTEYFILLMETIEASKGESETVAALTLLSMVLTTVPEEVLRKQFSVTAEVLLELLERFLESDNPVVKSIIRCMSVLLRVQENIIWTYSSTSKYLDVLLTLTIHTKPKIRKAAQNGVISIMHYNNHTNLVLMNTTKFHPAANRVAKFCTNQFKPEMVANSSTGVLYTMGLLRSVMDVFKSADIKSVCESILSLMTASNVMLRTKCLQTLHTLFASKTTNLNAVLCGKLIAAIYDFRPDKSDIRQILAWLTVVKEGHKHLAMLDLPLCISTLPALIDICTGELWMSEKHEIVSGVSNALKELLYDCVKPACETEELAQRNKVFINKIINSIGKILCAPFGEVAKYVILTFAIVFEVHGKYFGDTLKAPLTVLAGRYDTNNSLRVHIEHSIIAAIKSMGPEKALDAVPLTNTDGEVIVERSWMLPLLREGIEGATFAFFANYILPLAAKCNKKWNEFKAQKITAQSHIYELLCCQFWGLFPGFCKKPKDPENFRLIAKTLGLALTDNTDFRAPILDGFLELIGNGDENCKNEISKFSKNFLPRLFNIYTVKPQGTYEADLRKKMLEAIKEFLTIAPEATLGELFTNANEKLKSMTFATFEGDAVFDIMSLLLPYQNLENINIFYKTYIVPVLKNEKSKVVIKDEHKFKKQQRKTYELLYQILCEEKSACTKFCKKNSALLEKILIEALTTSCLTSQAVRLKCLKRLIETRQNLTIKDKLVVKTISEAVVSFKDFSSKKENISQELITVIGELFQKEDKLNDYIDIVMAGFGGDQTLVTNTICALRSIVEQLTGFLTVNTLEFILQQVLVFLVQKSRQEAEACVRFLLTFTKKLPSPLVANHLETIVKSLSAMMPDTKRYCRLQLGLLLKKLCKKFTTEEVKKYVPGNDETTHKRLKKIRKQLRREKRKKDEGELEEENDSEDDLANGLEKKSITIDDILADSDTDSNMSDFEKKNPKKSKKNTKTKETYILEGPDDIVDLADVKAIGQIVTDKPRSNGDNVESRKRKRDPNHGFKVAEDGRLIISDKGQESDSEEDSEEDEKPSKTMEEDSSDDDILVTPSRKKRALGGASSVASKKSMKSTATSGYKAGGKGIHRPVAASVKSGHSVTSKKSVAHSAFGSEFKSRKASGDMKRKGKLDPYAYIPLSRNILNKRKRFKNASQFTSIVKGARKGASKGVRDKLRKKYKK